MDTLSFSSPASSFGSFELKLGENSDAESIEVLGAEEDSSNLSGDSPFISPEGSSALSNIPISSSTSVEYESTPPKKDNPIALNMPGIPVNEEMALIETTDITTAKSKEEGIQLNSIETLFELLPAWKNVNGRRAIYGQITAADAARVVEHAAKVTRFIYPGRSSKDGANSIPVDAFIRFLQHIPSPLFQSLDSVHLLFVSVELHYLPLFFTPSLTHLEIGYISSDAAHAIGSFIASLPFEAPGIEHLELRGPCQLPTEAIDLLFQLKELRHIELDDIIPIERTSHILSQLAALPLLEVLHIVMRPPAGAPLEPLGSLDNNVGFSKLRRLQITGPLRLIYEAISLVSSRELHTLQLSAITRACESVRREEQAQSLAEQARRARIRQLQREKEQAQWWAAKEREIAIQESQVKVNNARMKVSEARSQLQSKERESLQAQQERRTKRIERRVKKLQASGVTEQILEEARQNWEREITLAGNNSKTSRLRKEVESLQAKVTSLSAELSSVERAHSLLLLAHESQSVSSVASVPEDIESESKATVAPGTVDEWQLTLNKIVDLTSNLWHETLENFALSIDKQSNSSSAPTIDLSALLSVIGQGWPSIRHLRLPINHTTGANFDMLHSIAKNSPLLEYLKLQMDVTTLPELPDKSGATFGLLHGLKTLSINSDTRVDDRHGRLRLARYINLLFPYLEALLSREDSQTAAMWNDIHNQIKFIQLIREDDRARGLLG